MIGPYLTDSIVLKQYKDEDEFGTPIARTSVTIKARIDYKNRQITSLEGEIVVSMARISIRDRDIIRSDWGARPTTDIAYEDLLYFDSVNHAIIRIGRQADFSTRFMEVYVA